MTYTHKLARRLAVLRALAPHWGTMPTDLTVGDYLGPLAAQLSSLHRRGTFDDTRIDGAVGRLRPNAPRRARLAFGASMRAGVYVCGFVQVVVLGDHHHLFGSRALLDDFQYHAVLRGHGLIMRHDPAHDDADLPAAPAHHRTMHLHEHDPFGDFPTGVELCPNMISFPDFVLRTEQWIDLHGARLPIEAPPIGVVAGTFERLPPLGMV